MCHSFHLGSGDHQIQMTLDWCFPVISTPHRNRPRVISRKNLSGACSKQSLSLKLGLLSAFAQVFPLPASSHLPAAICQADDHYNFPEKIKLCCLFTEKKWWKRATQTLVQVPVLVSVFDRSSYTCWGGYPAACSTSKHFTGHVQ